MSALDWITVKGFKSIMSIEELAELRQDQPSHRSERLRQVETSLVSSHFLMLYGMAAFETKKSGQAVPTGYFSVGTRTTAASGNVTFRSKERLKPVLK